MVAQSTGREVGAYLDLAQPLHIQRGADVHRTHHIGEQNRDLLVLRVDIAVWDGEPQP